jgi:predicted dehydrogenase
MNHPSLLLVGCGDMAFQYAKVLQALRVPFAAIGRRPETCAAFTEKTGVTALSGGLESALERTDIRPEAAIITVNMDQLARATDCLLGRGVPRILVEKPAGLNAAEITSAALLLKQAGSRVFVAYNRRFYASVRKARELIELDGGVTSFAFEFTEWSHQIEALPTPFHIKKEWFLGNSTHVCDLAFFLCGQPVELSTRSRGALAWHPAGAQFVGCGVSTTGALFSYHSNWESAGRWGLEICTRKRRLYLRPLETLSEQARGTLALVPVIIDDRLDKEFKPGLYEQTRAFLEGADGDLLPIGDQARHVAEVYARMVQPGNTAAHG